MILTANIAGWATGEEKSKNLLFVVDSQSIMDYSAYISANKDNILRCSLSLITFNHSLNAGMSCLMVA